MKSSQKISFRLARWVASGFGSGDALHAPGTFGSIAALIFWWIVQAGESAPDIRLQCSLALATCLLGVVAAAFARRLEETKDPQWIVIDEWAGMFVALLFVSPSSLGEMCAALALFRLFDVMKPGPVGMAERLSGAWGIMADDIVAGVLACSVLRVLV